MTIIDYPIDVAVALLVLLQIKQRSLATKALIRPLVTIGIAAASYLDDVATVGNTWA
jgi:hypothetical protein